MQETLTDLTAEHDDLDRLVAGLAEPGWETPTPAEGWAIRDQIGHLAFFDERQTLAATDPEAFGADAQRALAAEEIMELHLERGRAMR
ncbi:MAG: maleylpyruvate isomerase N-terminal domain-containing protein, partial [Acidimicrobiia bacterium]